MSSVVALIEEDLTLLTFERSGVEVGGILTDTLLSFAFEEIGAEVTLTEKQITLKAGDAPLAVTTQNNTQLVVLEVPGQQGPPGEDGVGGGGATFRPADLAGYATDYLYFGDEFDGWRVRRVHRTTQVAGIADISNNVGLADLTTAWTGKEALTYA